MKVPLTSPQVSADAVLTAQSSHHHRRIHRNASARLTPDGSWDHAHLSVTLSDSMFSVRRIIGDDWGSTSLSKWSQQRASLEIDYTAYGQPDPIVGLATDPWTDFPASGAASGDGVIDFFDMQSFLGFYSAQDPKADRNADGKWDIFDVTAYSADFAAGSQPLTPTGREDEEENPFGLAGYRYDRITALYHVRNRMLDPKQGKWLQRDPAGFVDGGNVYGYGSSHPIDNSDPFDLLSGQGSSTWEVQRGSKPSSPKTGTFLGPILSVSLGLPPNLLTVRTTYSLQSSWVFSETFNSAKTSLNWRYEYQIELSKTIQEIAENYQYPDIPIVNSQTTSINKSSVGDSISFSCSTSGQLEATPNTAVTRPRWLKNRKSYRYIGVPFLGANYIRHGVATLLSIDRIDRSSMDVELYSRALATDDQSWKFLTVGIASKNFKSISVKFGKSESLKWNASKGIFDTGSELLVNTIVECKCKK